MFSLYGNGVRGFNLLFVCLRWCSHCALKFDVSMCRFVGEFRQNNVIYRKSEKVNRVFLQEVVDIRVIYSSHTEHSSSHCGLPRASWVQTLCLVTCKSYVQFLKPALCEHLSLKSLK